MFVNNSLGGRMNAFLYVALISSAETIAAIHLYRAREKRGYLGVDG